MAKTPMRSPELMRLKASAMCRPTALLAHDDRADVGACGRLDDGVDGIGDEELDALALQDFGYGIGDLHGVPLVGRDEPCAAASVYRSAPALAANEGWRAQFGAMPLLSVISDTPGAGKTGVAASVARDLAYAGRRVWLVRGEGANAPTAPATPPPTPTGSPHLSSRRGAPRRRSRRG